MKLKFNDMFKPSLLAMRFNRSDPAIKKDIKWFSWFLVVHGIYTVIGVIIMYNVVYVNLKRNQFSETCKNSVLTVVYSAITLQNFVMIWHQKNLKLLMDTIKRDYLLAKSLSVTEQAIVHEFAMKGNHVCNQWLLISVWGAGIFPVKNIVLISMNWVAEGEIAKIPMYDLVYPAFIEDRKDSNVVYTITYLTMLAYAVYSAVTYCAFVPLGPIFMLHACGQLEVVKSRIDILFNSDDLDEVRQNLNGIVKQLKCIYDFVEIIKICFMFIYEVTLKITTILLPITCYAVLEPFSVPSLVLAVCLLCRLCIVLVQAQNLESLKLGDLSLEFVIFIFGGVLFSSSPCFYGDLLVEKGEGVRLAMYSCGWERVYDRKLRSTVRIVLQRASRPVAVRTLFRTLCLNALTDLFHQSYTIFNLMNAAWN